MRFKILFPFLALSFVLVSSTIDMNELFNYADLPISNDITGANNFEDDLPNDNPITDAGATLGRVLFYDKQLSLNNSISCSSCHHQEFAFSDTSVVSTGFDGGVTGRHSMRLVNARYVNEVAFFWDERANTLEDQTTQPLRDAVEMGWSGTNGQPSFDSLISRMEALPYYTPLFNSAFGDNTITEVRMQEAFGQFLRSIISFDSRYDVGLAAANGNTNANFSNFTTSENNGKTLFAQNSDQGGAGCQSCHRAPVFDIRDDSDNNGVISVANDPTAQDFTNTRSPSLRDLVNPSGALNGPMMHDGSHTTMREMIDHYDDVPFNNQLDNRLRQGRNNGQNLNLTEQEKIDLEAFLLTLTGSNMYVDEKYSDPFDANGYLILLDTTCQDGDQWVNYDISNLTYELNAIGDIVSSSVISDSARVTYQSSTSLEFDANFTIELGSELSASIDDCAN